MIFHIFYISGVINFLVLYGKMQNKCLLIVVTILCFSFISHKMVAGKAIDLVCWFRCNTCGEYIYKGKKFNSRKETVENENYLGLHIFRFYIKCPQCVAEIAFKVSSARHK